MHTQAEAYYLFRHILQPTKEKIVAEPIKELQLELASSPQILFVLACTKRTQKIDYID
jgi:hypothetical protein